MAEISDLSSRIPAEYPSSTANSPKTPSARPKPAPAAARPHLLDDPWLGFDAYCPELREAKKRTAELSNGNAMCLVLAGRPGSGKSHLARVVYWHHHPLSKMVSEPDMLSDIQKTYSGNEGGSESGYIRDLRTIPMLILDDVGTGHVRPESRTWLEGIYWRILDRRSEKRLPLVITTNLNLAELTAWLGERAMSRLWGLIGARENFVSLFRVADYRTRQG